MDGLNGGEHQHLQQLRVVVVTELCGQSADIKAAASDLNGGGNGPLGDVFTGDRDVTDGAIEAFNRAVVSTADPDLLGAWIQCAKIGSVVGEVKNIIHKDLECSTGIGGGISNANRHKLVVGVGAVPIVAVVCK